MQARPDKARAYGVEAVNRALEGIEGMTALHICFGYAAHPSTNGPNGYSFLPELCRCKVRQISIETAQSNLDTAVLEGPAGPDDHPRRHRPATTSASRRPRRSPRASAARCRMSTRNASSSPPIAA